MQPVKNTAVHWGLKIKDVRKGHKLSHRDAEKITGYVHSRIPIMEKNPYPPLKYIIKLCDYVGLPLWNFFSTDIEDFAGYWKEADNGFLNDFKKVEELFNNLKVNDLEKIKWFIEYLIENSKILDSVNDENPFPENDKDEK